jgi:hypothetical protein
MKKKSGIILGTVSALTAATLVIGGVTVFAANDTDNTEAIYEEEGYYEEEIDYGNLSEDEINRLNAIYDRLWAIEDEIYGEEEELDEATYNERFKKYEAEYNKLDDEALDLEMKAGWYGELNKDEVKHLYDLYDQIDTLDEEAYQLEVKAGWYNE